MGGARTALFNWLYARKMGGTFLLRIEDTDRQRSSEEHTRVILDGLTWLGLDWDEDVAFQGAGIARHQALADRLLAEDKAYEDDGAIRFRMPRGEIAWDDAVYGHISFQGEEIKDWIILRSDRTPTYNFTVVADDVAMRVTHVMRGDDHISNTPKQIAVYQALGASRPIFAHVPMIHGPDGKKLSKRHGATAVGDYRNLGILPGAMRNFLALLGWNPGDDRELFFDVAELIGAFSLERVQKTAAIFDMAKLEWMNGHYLRETPVEQLTPLVRSHFAEVGFGAERVPPDRLRAAVEVARERTRTTVEAARLVANRLDATLRPAPDAKAQKEIAKDPERFRLAIRAAAEHLGAIEESGWQPEPLETELRALAERLGIGAGKVFQPIRIALTGTTASEPVNVLLALVGKETSLARLRAALER